MRQRGSDGPAGPEGENLATNRNISVCRKVLSPTACGRSPLAEGAKGISLSSISFGGISLMPRFRYTATNEKGKTVRGLLEAPSEEALYAKLRNDGLYMTDAQEAQKALSLIHI